MYSSLKKWLAGFLVADHKTFRPSSPTALFAGAANKRALSKIRHAEKQGQLAHWLLDFSSGQLHIDLIRGQKSIHLSGDWRSELGRLLGKTALQQIEEHLGNYHRALSSNPSPADDHFQLNDGESQFSVYYWPDQQNTQLVRGIVIETSTLRAAREAITSSQSLIEGLISSSLDCIKILDSDGHLLEMSPNGQKAMAVSDFELIRGSYWPDFWSQQEDHENACAAVREAADGRSYRFTGQRPTLAGEPKWWEVTAYPLGGDEEQRQILCVSRDITREKNTAAELAVANAILEEDINARSRELNHQQELNRLLLDTMSEGVVACDQQGELILFNKTARDWHGMDPRNVPASEWAKYYSLYDADGLTPLQESQIPLIRAFNGEYVRAAGMAIARSGHPTRHVLASGGPIFDKEGVQIGAVATMRDITEERKSRLSLEKAAVDLRSANVVIKQERALLENRVEKRTRELKTLNEELNRASQKAEAASRAKSAFLATMSHEIRTPMNGVVGMLDVLAGESLSENQQEALNTIRQSSSVLLRLIDDVLDFSKIEAGKMELEHSPLELRSLLENVCTLLLPLARENNVLLSPYVDPAIPERIMGDSTRLQQIFYNLIGNAVKFSGHKSGRPGLVGIHARPSKQHGGSLEIVITDNGIGIPREIIPTLFSSFTQAESSTTRNFGGSGLGLAITRRLIALMGGDIELDSTVGEGTSVTLTLPLNRAQFSKPSELRQLQCRVQSSNLWLMSKLVSYLELGGAHVTGTNSELPDNDPTVEASILIAAASDNRKDRSVQLNIKLAEQHILVQESPACFSLQSPFLNFRELVRALKVCSGRATLEESPRGKSFAADTAIDEEIRILIAEDDKTNQQVIGQQLKLLGIQGDIANNGREAMDLFQRRHYDLVLTDMHMPEVDGVELARRIREHEANEALERTPVIALSADVIRGETHRRALRHVDAYLAKPIQLHVLRKELSHWLKQSDSSAEPPGNEVAILPSPPEKVLRVDQLHAVISDDPRLVQTTLANYLNTARDQVDTLCQALASGKLEETASLAHRLKGSSSMVGGEALSELCAELEQASRSRDHTRLGTLEAQLRREFQQLNTAITHHLDTLALAC